MIANCEIAADKGHIANLAFACVGKRAISAQSIVIAVLIAGLAGKEEYQRRRFWCRDAALSRLLGQRCLWLDWSARIDGRGRGRIGRNQMVLIAGHARRLARPPQVLFDCLDG